MAESDWMTFEILQGDALSVLRGMPSESVQTCITSPPYYGLRSYGTEPQVWGNHNGCSHEWNESSKKISLQAGNPEFVRPWRENATGESFSGFCLSCNAWRGELGLEPTFQLYISHLIEIFAEVKRVLKKDGTCWVNLGDSFNGAKVGNTEIYKHPNLANGTNHRKELQNTLREKSLMNIPARFAIAMTDELKMIQRNEIIWYKRACMPSSAKDRFTVDFEKIFFFSREPRYKFNQQLENAQTEPGLTWAERKGAGAVAGNLRDGYNGAPHGVVFGKGVGSNLTRQDGMRNKRCVWDVPFEPSGDEHYASYPTKLVEPMILAGTDEGDTVLDIFNGTGTTGLTAVRNRRRYIGIELNEKYVEMTRKRLREVQVKLF